MAPTPSRNPEASMALLRLVSGAWTAQAVHVAARLGIADLLADGPKAPDMLAAATGAHGPTLERLLRALASLGVFAEQPDGRFGLTPLADGLRRDAEDSLRDYAVMMGDEWHWRAWGGLLHSVRTGESAFEHAHGRPLFDYLADHPAAGQVFDDAMTSRTRQEVAVVTAAYDWPAAGTVVDVGGGRGALLAAILEARPDTRGVLFDLPHVIEAAREGPVQPAVVAARCELVAGSFFEHVPAGGDLYLLKRVLHDWDDERAAAILSCCRRAMGSLGRLLVIEHVLPPGNEPSWGKLLDLQMLVLTQGGRERDEAGFRSLLASAGLRLQRVVPAGPTASLVEAVAGEAEPATGGA